MVITTTTVITKKKQCMADRNLREDADIVVHTDIKQIDVGNETHNCDQTITGTATVTVTTTMGTTIEIIQTR
jgi:hypothetical protein